MNAGPDQRDRQARCSGGPIDKARWSIELNAATRNWHVVEKAVGRPSCWLLTDVVLRTPRRSGGREPILALLWQIFAADERDGIPKSVFQ